LRHRGVVTDQRCAVELARELLTHDDAERTAQAGHADHTCDWRTLARRDQRQRRALAVPEQHDAREPRIASQRFGRRPSIRGKVFERQTRDIDRALGGRQHALVVAQRRDAALCEPPGELRVGIGPDAHH